MASRGVHGLENQKETSNHLSTSLYSFWAIIVWFNGFSVFHVCGRSVTSKAGPPVMILTAIRQGRQRNTHTSHTKWKGMALFDHWVIEKGCRQWSFKNSCPVHTSLGTPAMVIPSNPGTTYSEIRWTDSLKHAVKQKQTNCNGQLTGFLIVSFLNMDASK